MNVFFVFDDGSLQTPPLGGTILPGVTRDAIITLARAEGRTVREERFSYEQWKGDAASGRLRKSFACGTAAVVTPHRRDQGGSKAASSSAMVSGSAIAEALRAKLVGIQRGDLADEHGWVRRVLPATRAPPESTERSRAASTGR